MIIGSRGSELALKQLSIFVNKVKLKNYVIKIIKTKGDITKKPLQKIGIGVFTKELGKALIDKKIDLAVHSLKDIPVEGFNPKLEIAAIVERADPRDCLIFNQNIFNKNNIIIGTDSIRRQYELNNFLNKKYEGKKIKFVSLRGNIPTRIKKLENKEYDAIIVAKAALDRLKIRKKIKVLSRTSRQRRAVLEHVQKHSAILGGERTSSAGQLDQWNVSDISIKQMVPAAGQGAIAVVKRKKDKFPFLKKDELYDCCMLEREFIKGLGGCKKPVGAYCQYKNRKFDLIGLVFNKNKRILVNFSGNKKIIKNKIKKWKARYI